MPTLISRLQLSHLNYRLLLPALLLSAFGILTLSSINPDLAKQQLIFLLVALFFYWLTSRLDYHLLPKLSPFIYVGLVIFLLLPSLLGSLVRGTERWITIGNFNIQPSVISLPWLLVIISSWYSTSITLLKRVLGSVVILLPPFWIIFSQPDLGTALVLAAGFFGIFFTFKFSLKQIFSFALVAILIIVSSPLILKPYQKQRLTSFLHPSSDPLGSGYHVLQSTIAIGSGRLFGRGFNQGIQSQLRFLPASQTDFIFATAAEEFGFLGSLILLAGYLALLSSLLFINLRSDSPLEHLIISSIFVSLLFQTFVNLGMNVSLAPVTGIPLPAVSYGGSSLLAFFISLGLINSITTHQPTQHHSLHLH
jgi:rod shape determining protein RodA